MSKSVVRSVKNVTKGYSSVQVKVRNATSNDAWGPTGSDMQEIAQMTSNSSGEFYEIMDILDKRLNDKGKNWRHVLKSLRVLDYCLHEGSELVVAWARKHIYVIKTLREFQYIDDDGRDVGSHVRSSAKQLTSLILDEDRLRAERHDRRLWKSRVTTLDEFPPSGYPGQGSDPSSSHKQERRSKNEDEDLEYKLALEASKNELEEDRKRRESHPARDDDDDLARAIKLSQEEEELRRKELEQQNAASLFDDTPTPTQQQSQPTGWNQGYQQQSAVDWFGNPLEQQQQQPQSTGFLNNAYAQPFGFQNQPTGFQNGYGYNPYQQTALDQSQYQQQPQFMQPAQTAFNVNNPYGQQPQLAQEEESAQKPGSQNPWANLDKEQSLPPQPTGSNNPFATQISRPPQPSKSAQKAPTLNTLAEQKTATQFNPFPATTSSPQRQQTQTPPQKETDPYASRLNALLATGDGQDTFGNVGELRIPAQHTAPGTFVNSAGSGINRLQPSATGTNPFMQSQFTGLPAQNQVPAQTGPAHSFGGGSFGGLGSSNPFAGSSGQQPQQQQQNQNQAQSASLIDL